MADRRSLSRSRPAAARGSRGTRLLLTLLLPPLLLLLPQSPPTTAPALPGLGLVRTAEGAAFLSAAVCPASSPHRRTRPTSASSSPSSAATTGRPAGAAAAAAAASILSSSTDPSDDAPEGGGTAEAPRSRRRRAVPAPLLRLGGGGHRGGVGPCGAASSPSFSGEAMLRHGATADSSPADGGGAAAAVAIASDEGVTDGGPVRSSGRDEAAVVTDAEAEAGDSARPLPKILVEDDRFLRPGPDARKYRTIELPNGLRCLLVSDPRTDVEAGAVHLAGVGHFQDLEGRKGLAHFHEHMLFLGTGKYPGEGEYEDFLSRHGGSSNAYTDMEDTNYYFSVAPLDHDGDGGGGIEPAALAEEEAIHHHDPDAEDIVDIVAEVDTAGGGVGADDGGGDADVSEVVTLDLDLDLPVPGGATVPPNGGGRGGGGDGATDSAAIPTTTVSGALYGALDRFGQFFVSPSFRSDAVERELRAIDSEYANGLTDDSWRSYQLLKSGCDPRHPFHKFGCGNYATLTNGGNLHDKNSSTYQLPFHGGSDPSADLVQFWTDHYHAGNMKLAVLGRANLDDLQAAVMETFGQVRSGAGGDSAIRENRRHTAVDAESAAPRPNEEDWSMPPPSPVVFSSEHSKYGVAAFGPDRLGIIREVVPVKDQRIVKINFAIPPVDDPVLKSFLPQRLVSHLLGHESPGSLHSVLNDLGYINSLSSGISVDASDFAFFGLGVSLTPRGMEKLDEVLDLCFQWIALIRSIVETEVARPNAGGRNHSRSLMEQYHDELRQMASIRFQFRENGDPTGFCSSAAELLHKYEEDSHLILAGNAMFANYSAPVTLAFLDRLRPDNALITVSDRKFSQKEDTATLADVAESGGLAAVSARHAPWQRERWYGAEYRQVKIPKSVATKWNDPPEIDSRLHLPAFNQFISTDFSLRCDDDDDGGDTETDTRSPGQARTKLSAGDPFEDATTNASKKGLSMVPPRRVVLGTKTSSLQLWHKMDRAFRVPKTSMQVHFTSPNVYRSPRSMTLCRLFSKVLNDDLNSFAYDASLAGSNYRITVSPTGYTLVVSGYSDKMPVLLDAISSRIMSIIEEMKEGEEARPTLAAKYQKAIANLLRETKNYRLDSPLEIATYQSRLLLEDNVWHVDDYIAEMEGDAAVADPLTMEECGRMAEKCLSGRVKVEALCMGNVNEDGTKELATVIESRILKPSSRPLSEDEKPSFRSLQLPTRGEAEHIFGTDLLPSIPVVVEQMAFGESEENHAVEITLQASCGHTLGYEGVALLQLIGHMAYPSAYNMLRTKEQLGYIVSAHVRRTAGYCYGLSIEVQSNTALPHQLEERCEAWLSSFRSELEDMPAERMAMEAAAVVAQLLERDTRLSDETSRLWGDILGAVGEPAFDRLERLAEILTVDGQADQNVASSQGPRTPAELKTKALDCFDRFFAASSGERRAMSSRIYGQKARPLYEKNKGKPGILPAYDDVRFLKRKLFSLPLAPYWEVQKTLEDRKAIYKQEN